MTKTKDTPDEPGDEENPSDEHYGEHETIPDSTELTGDDPAGDVDATFGDDRNVEHTDIPASSEIETEPEESEPGG